MLAVDRGLSMRKLLSALLLGFNSAKRGMFHGTFRAHRKVNAEISSATADSE
jgi:hypothetical protein